MDKFFWYLIILILLLFFLHKVETSKAQELTIIHVQAPNAPTTELVKEIYSKASWYFQQVGVTFRVRILSREVSQCMRHHSPDIADRIEQIECFNLDAAWEDYAHPYPRYRRWAYYITPPFTYPDGTTSIGGVSHNTCGLVATGNAQEKNYLGEPRIDHSAVVMGHELFHTAFCATHIDSKPNLMHSNANIFTTQYRGRLPLLRITKRQAKRAKAKWRYLND